MLDINNFEISSRATGEAEIIRALLMGIDRLLRGSSMANLVAEPIEHIHRSLDRIESVERSEPERRRPGRTEYLSPEIIAMSRQTAKDKPKPAPTRAPQKISYWRDLPSTTLIPPAPEQSLTIGVLALVA
jgi:hypothetical protein